LTLSTTRGESSQGQARRLAWLINGGNYMTKINLLVPYQTMANEFLYSELLPALGEQWQNQQDLQQKWEAIQKVELAKWQSASRTVEQVYFQMRVYRWAPGP
jgi:hypothetical protein